MIMSNISSLRTTITRLPAIHRLGLRCVLPRFHYNQIVYATCLLLLIHGLGQIVPSRKVNALSSRVSIPVSTWKGYFQPSDRPEEVWRYFLHRTIINQRLTVQYYSDGSARVLMDGPSRSLARINRWCNRLVAADVRPGMHSTIQFGFPFRALYGTASSVVEPGPAPPEGGASSPLGQRVQHTTRGIDTLEIPLLGACQIVYLPIWSGLLLNVVFWLICVICMQRIATRLLRLHRLWRNRCMVCAYDLRGLSSEQCPECGALTCAR